MNIERKATWSQQSILWLVGSIAILIDQATKRRIEATLEPYTAHYPIESLGEFFRYYHLFNEGAAFDLLDGGGFTWFLTAIAFGISLFLLAFNYSISGNHIGIRITLGLILGGALGNGIDRIRLGHVTDYIDFNLRPLVANYPALDFPLLNIPVFNWADVFVIGGAISLLIIAQFEEIPESYQQLPSESEALV